MRAATDRLWTCGVYGCVWLLGACADPSAGADWQDPISASDLPDRVVRETEWIRVFALGGTLDDTLFHNPGTVRPLESGGVVVVDQQARRVVAVRPDGDVLWSFGRPGEGPEEFGVPSDAAAAGNGRLLILDRELGRITVLSAVGELERHIALDAVESLADRFAFATPRTIGLIAPTADRPIIRIDTAGKLVGSHRFPWEDFQRLEPIPRVFATAAASGSDEWAAAFTYGTALFRLRGADRVGERALYPELVRFPDMVETRRDGKVFRRVVDPSYAGVGVTLSSARIHVLFGGGTEHALRLVDSYDRRTGAYVETYLLPHRVTALAHGDGSFYVLRADPYPVLERWAPVTGAIP